jgi:hypothetical protein
MAVNNPGLTRRVEKSAEYINEILKKNWKSNEENIVLSDSDFDNMVMVSYPVSVLLNDVYRSYMALKLGAQGIDPCKAMPREETVMHVSTILGSYMDGVRSFPRADLQEMAQVCEAFAKGVRVIEKSKARKI